MEKIMHKLIVISVLSLAAFISILFEDELFGTSANDGTIQFTVENISCTECTNSLQDAIENIVGIQEYVVDEKNHLIKIQFDPLVMDEDWIEKALKANGYIVEEY